jgi:uncharacterized protein with PQ loop repeat
VSDAAHWAANWAAWIGTALTMIAFVPQIMVLARQRRAGALSGQSLGLDVVAGATLLVYAVVQRERVFVVVLAFQLACSLAILALGLAYRTGR